MDDLEITKACALAMGWKHLGAVGVELSEAERGSPSRADKAYPGKLWCLSGGNDWWLNPEGYHVCGPCQGIPDPLHDDAQAMALVKRFHLSITPEFDSTEWSIEAWARRNPVALEKEYGVKVLVAAQDADLNRAICLCVARLPAAQRPGGKV